MLHTFCLLDGRSSLFGWLACEEDGEPDGRPCVGSLVVGEYAIRNATFREADRDELVVPTDVAIVGLGDTLFVDVS